MKEKTPTNLLNSSDYLPCQMKLGSSQDIVVVLQKKNLQKQIMAKKYDFTFFWCVLLCLRLVLQTCFWLKFLLGKTMYQIK